MSARTRGRSRLNVRYFDDRILLTETHAWTYFRLPTESYEFITPQERETLATSTPLAASSSAMNSGVHGVERIRTLALPLARK